MTESKENYLEIILILGNKTKKVRAIDVAKYLVFSRPSVSIAMKTLKKEGFISIQDDGNITLTPKGKSIALKVYEKHKLLCAWFIKLGVDEDNALKDACKIEHIISEKSFLAIKKFLNKK